MAETQPGGAYEVGGKIVDANGQPTKIDEAAKEAAQEAADAGNTDNTGETGTTDDTALANVKFASPAAREAAKGLVADDFKRKHKSSDRGFTVDDVERIRAGTAEGSEADEGEEE
jgi:hypothetical protein